MPIKAENRPPLTTPWVQDLLDRMPAKDRERLFAEYHAVQRAKKVTSELLEDKP